MSYLVNLDYPHGSPQELVSGEFFIDANTPKFWDGNKGIFKRYNGSNQRSYAPNANIGNITTGDFSIEVWVRFNDLSGTKWILSKYGASGNIGYSLYRNTTSIIPIICDSSGYTTGGIVGGLSIGIWYHVISTFDRDGNNITYLQSVAGTPVSISSRQLSISNGVALTFGSYTGGADYCNCDIARVYVHDKVLSASEVKARYAIFYAAKQEGEVKINPRDYYADKPVDDIRSGILLHCSYKQGSVDDLTPNLKHGTKSGNVQRINEGISLRINGKVVHGNIGSVKTVAFRIRLKSTSEKLMEKAANSGLIYVNAGTLTAADFSSIYIEGQSGTTMVANLWYDVVLRNASTVSFTAFTLGLNNITYGNFDIEDLILSSNQESDTWVAQYHNQFASRCRVQSELEFDAVNNSAKQWVKGTTSSILVTQTSVAGTLPKGTKYIKFGSNGTAYLPASFLASFVKNGYADYWALVSGTWYHRQGFVTTGGLTELSYSNGRLVYTAANANDGVAGNMRYKLMVNEGQRV